MNISIVSYIFIFLVAFFPAYLGYQEQHAWVGYVFTIGFALSSYIPFLRDYKRQWWIALVVLILFGYTIESIGVLTCLPYGCFAYSNQLWPKLLGIVPRLLAFTRPPLVIWVWQQILRLQHLFAFTTWDHDQGEKEKIWHGWKLWLLWGIGLVVVDLILDPIAVMMGLWSFEQQGWWFGIPWTNFAGWMLSGTIGVMIIDLITNPSQSALSEKNICRDVISYVCKNYSHGLRCTMAFFVGYAVWRVIVGYWFL